MIEAELPDGTVLEFPDGTHQDVVQRTVKKRLGVASVEAPKPDYRAQAIQMAKPELLQPLKNIAGGAIRGAGSIGATAMRILPNMLGGDTAEENAQRRSDMDAGLQNLIGADPESFDYQAAKLGGEIAGTAGVPVGLAALGARAGMSANALSTLASGGFRGGNMLQKAAAGATVGGISAGMVNPNDAATGAGIGGVLPGGVKVAGLAGDIAGKTIRGNIDPLARKAVEQYGIPVSVADTSKNSIVKAVRSILSDAPITGGIAQKQMAAKQYAFNRAISKTFGEDAAKITPEVIDSAKGRMGQEFDRLWNGNVLNVDQDMMTRLSSLREQAGKLPKNEGNSVVAEIDDLISKMQPGQNNELFIPGDVANKFQSYLRRRAESSAGLKNELGDLRKTVISAFNRSVSPDDAQALGKTMSQYKAFKTLEPILNKGEAGVAGREIGDVPAALLPSRVAQQYGSGVSTSPFADLSPIAGRFMVDRVPQTGGSARALIQNSAIGTGLALGGAANPLAAMAAVPMAMQIQRYLGSPVVSTQSKNALLQMLQENALKAAPVIAAD